MFKVGDKVRVVRVDKEDLDANLKIGDVGTVTVIRTSYVCVDFGGIATTSGRPIGEFYEMHAEQLEKVEDKPMTRDDLKDGMICIIRGGTQLMWLNDALRGLDVWCSGTKNDLTGTYCVNDIIAIYAPVGETIEEMLDHDYSAEPPIWKRREPIKMTLKEAEERLEEELGCPVEITK